MADENNDVPTYTNQTLISLYDLSDSAHHCGYCDKNGSVSNGMSADSLDIQDYQLLVDRGWRRSGAYCYKPVMQKTCCPLYTIKCDAINLKLTKTQKHVLTVVNNFLEKNQKPAEKRNKSSAESSKSKANDAATGKSNTNKKSNDNQNNAQKVIEYFLANQNENKINEPNFKLKSKHKRLFRKCLKLNQKSKSLGKQLNKEDIENGLKRRDRNKPFTLEERLNLSEKAKNKIEVTTIRSWPPGREFIQTLNEEHKVYEKYQMAIHHDSKAECSINQFKRFLCTSPLSHTNYYGPSSVGYGSFHQQYRLNGKLIAVGVIDILNYCVSSVYFFYDPEYNFLNLGTYSALREIEFTRKLHQEDPLIQYYYLGFYAHNCQKMKYKGQFRPSYLLCPEVYTWHPIEECIPLLNKTKYNRLNPDKNAKDTNEAQDVDNIKVRVRMSGSIDETMNFATFLDSLYPAYAISYKKLMIDYCKLFGKEFSKNAYFKF